MKRCIHQGFIVRYYCGGDGRRYRHTRTKAGEGSAAEQALDASRGQREDGLGLATAPHRPDHALTHHGRFHLAAERSPTPNRRPTRPTSAEDREPTRRGRARSTGAACPTGHVAGVSRSNGNAIARSRSAHLKREQRREEVGESEDAGGAGRAWFRSPE